MKKIANKYWNILEFDKIIDEVKKEVRLDYNKDILDNLTLFEDEEEIRDYMEKVDEASKLILRFDRFPLLFNSDIDYILEKTKKHGVMSIEELLEIGKFFDTIKNIIIYNENLENALISHPYFEEKANKLIYFKNVNLRIKEIVSPFGEIYDTASLTLKDIRKRIIETEKNIQSKLQEIISKNSSKLTQTIVSIRNDRYVIPVKNDFKNTIKGIVHDQSSSGETVFIEPQIICDLNNRLNQLREDEKKEIYEILRAISLEIANINCELNDDLNIIIELDMIFGKASYANKINASKVNINSNGIVDLISCRHPLLKVENVVSNNISIGKDYKGIIITGPNTGGKTVLLKTIGLLALMTKAGMLLPCSEESTMMVFDEVYADIGDEQSISQNLSTFSSHLKNVIEILNNVTQNSLVVLDELGSGTDPVEGSSLAIAIFDELISKQCLVIATSHYSELKVHAFNREDIINASVEFDINTLRPTYKLLLGVPGQSNALNISRILGLPENIIKKAKDYSSQNSDDVDISLKKLIRQTQEMDKKLKKINIKKAEWNRKIAEVDERLEEINDEKNKILKKAEEEAKKIIEKSNKKIESILEELESMKLREVKLHEISDVKHKIRETKKEAHIEETFISKNEDIKVGDTVFIQNYGCNGIVLKEMKNDKYSVQMGNATITVDKSNLRKNSKPQDNIKNEFVTSKKSSITVPTKSVKMSLDLRGERYEDAAILIDKYLDDAIFAGFKQVSIIHGFGTGVIRELVQKTLKNNKNVESFRYGGNGEGGLGATIVTFKD